MVKSELVVPKVWRSELKGIALFLFFCILAVMLSRMQEVQRYVVIEGRLFSIGSYNVMLTLPLLWFVPFITLVSTAARIYNVRFTIDSRGVQSKVGILSMNQRITRVRYEDIRSIETEQTLVERMLDIGTVEISTAATGSVEILLTGIAAPKEVQDMLQRERDSRQKAEKDAVKRVFEERASEMPV